MWFQACLKLSCSVVHVSNVDTTLWQHHEGYTRAPTQFDLKSVHRLTRQIPNCSNVWHEVKRQIIKITPIQNSLCFQDQILRLNFWCFNLTTMPPPCWQMGPWPRASSSVAMPPANYCEALQDTCNRTFPFGEVKREGPFRFHMNFHESSGVPVYLAETWMANDSPNVETILANCDAIDGFQIWMRDHAVS